MPDRMERVDRWLMRHFLANPNAVVTVEDLAKRCLRELATDLSGYTWQQIVHYFMHALTTHHALNDRLTQSRATGGAGQYGLRYKITAKGRADFAARLEAGQAR